MKMNRIIIICVFVLYVQVIPIFAADRVICGFSPVTETSGRIELHWKEKGTEPIQITGYSKINDHTIEIGYRTGSEVPSFDHSLLSMETVNFPPQIILANPNDSTLLTDMDEERESYYPVMNLYSQGILSGYPDGTFQPEKNVKREEFAAMIVSGAKMEPTTGLASTFTDVSEARWSKNYIMTLANKGIINGKGNQLFAPQDNITIGEAAAVLDRTFSFYEKEEKSRVGITTEHWSNGNIYSLLEAEIIVPTDSFYQNYDPNKPATREECAVMINRVLLSYHGVNP